MLKDHSDSERGNPISSKRSFISTVPQTRQHITRPLLHQSWSSDWKAKYLNELTMKDRSDEPSHHELHLAPAAVGFYIGLLIHVTAFNICNWSERMGVEAFFFKNVLNI